MFCTLMGLLMPSFLRGWEGFLALHQTEPRQPRVWQPRGKGGGGSCGWQREAGAGEARRALEWGEVLTQGKPLQFSLLISAEARAWGTAARGWVLHGGFVKAGGRSYAAGSLSGLSSGRGPGKLQALWLLSFASCCLLVGWLWHWPAPLWVQWWILAGAAGTAEVCGG